MEEGSNKVDYTKPNKTTNKWTEFFSNGGVVSIETAKTDGEKQDTRTNRKEEIIQKKT